MKTEAKNTNRQSAVVLCCEEPFRVFFPAGSIIAIVGISLWILYYSGVGIFYPNIAHARLMIQGFMASFVFGFLGTAGPRLTSAPHFSLGELVTIFSLDIFAAGLHLGQAHVFGDLAFVVCLLFFIGAMGRRFHKRKDSPPPNFVLVALGLMSGVVGAALIAFTENAQYSRTYQIGTALLNQCFLLLPILGIAPFFIGRLLDLPSPDLPESHSFPSEWPRQAASAGFVGLTIVLSFLLDAYNLSRFGGWLRVVAITVYLVAHLPLRGRAFLAICLRIAMASIVMGFVLIALLPVYRIGALHIVFIAGFNFMMFTVGTRVIFGHSGNLARVRTRMPFFIIMAVILLLAAISRFTADLAPAARTVHLVGAAICWLIAALIWMLKVVPGVRLSEMED